MPKDNHSITVNKGVCNILDVKVRTTLVVGSEVSSFELKALIGTTSAKPKDNDKRVWPIWSTGPLFRARKLFIDFSVIEGVARDTD